MTYRGVKSVVESFFATLKRELVSHTQFATRNQARQEIFASTGRYNTRGIHVAPDYYIPTEWEDHHRQRLEQAAYAN